MAANTDITTKGITSKNILLFDCIDLPRNLPDVLTSGVIAIDAKVNVILDPHVTSTRKHDTKSPRS
jgi:hypothetical protein